MELKNYLDCDSKSKHFCYHQIKTKDDFDKNYKRLLNKDCFVFRGVNEAKYKLFTSAQRKWITAEMYLQGITFVDFIDDLLSNIKNNHLLSNYFKSINVPTNDILYLSFLQHYGAPSPLLDFTKNKNIALYFALNGLNTRISGESGIENYFSFYVVIINSEIITVDKLIKKAINDGRKMVNDYKKNHKQKDVNDDILKYIDLSTAWKKKDGTSDGLHNIHLGFISNPLNSVKVFSTTGQPLLWSNLNIIAQKGCFIMNTHETQPLEEVIENKIIEETDNLKKIVCFDIHKSLAGYIKTTYLKHVKEEQIYPSYKNIASDAYEKFMQKK